MANGGEIGFGRTNFKLLEPSPGEWGKKRQPDEAMGDGLPPRAHALRGVALVASGEVPLSKADTLTWLLLWAY